MIIVSKDAHNFHIYEHPHVLAKVNYTTYGGTRAVPKMSFIGTITFPGLPLVEIEGEISGGSIWDNTSFVERSIFEFLKSEEIITNQIIRDVKKYLSHNTHKDRIRGDLESERRRLMMILRKIDKDEITVDFIRIQLEEMVERINTIDCEIYEKLECGPSWNQLLSRKEQI